VNEEEFAPGAGLPFHSHRDVEIVSLVQEGGFSQRTTSGEESTVSAGCYELLRAGSGWRHEEGNASSKVSARRLQLWFTPKAKGEEPRVSAEALSAMRPFWVAGNEIHFFGGAGAGTHHAEGIYGHRFWLQVLKGRVAVAGHALTAGDGAAIEGVRALSLSWAKGAAFLFIDLKE